MAPFDLFMGVASFKYRHLLAHTVMIQIWSFLLRLNPLKPSSNSTKTHQNKSVNQITNIAVINSYLFKQDYKSTVLNDGATVQ